MTDRRTWLPVAVAIALVAGIVGLIVLVRSDVEVTPIDVTVPGEGGPLDLDAAVYRSAGATVDDPRPAVLLAHGFLGDRTGMDARARELADDGFVVLTWSARGFGASGGEVGLADPEAEIADVSRLVDELAMRPEVLLDAPDDPRVAIVGGSYGAGTALLAATQEPRLDAVVAVAGWHSLSRSLAPNGLAGPGEIAPGVLKSSWTSLLFTANTLPSGSLAGGAPNTDPGSNPCGRFSAEICAAYRELAREGVMTEAAREVLDARGPAGRLHAVRAPTLLLQGQDDTLFDLTESRRNAEEIAATGTPVRLRWIVGGHELVGGAATEESRAEIATWLDRWLREGDGPADGPFTWTDQAADARQDRDALPDGGDGTLVYALTADGGLASVGDADPGGSTLTLSSPPGGQPAALSALPGAGALVGFLPTTDIPGQHVALTSAPMADDTTLLGAPTMTLSVLTVDGADGAETGDGADGAEVGDVSDPQGAVLGDGGEARLFVKLTDVAADGSTTLIHQGVTPVRSTSLPARLEVVLPDLAHRLRTDHRLRVTIATTDQAFTNRTDGASTRLAFGDGASSIRLPIVAGVTPGSAAPVLVGLLTVITLVAVGLGLRRRRPRADRSGSAASHRTGRDREAGEDPSGDPGSGPRTGPGRSPGRTVEVPDPPPIAIRGLSKRYADGHLAVDGLDLVVGRGQVVGLLGPNGAGKTTTLRMLLGLSTPTAGSIRVFGHDMRAGHPVLGRVGALVEGPGFVPELSGMDNLQLYWRAAGPRSLDGADLPRALDVADLGGAIRKPVRTYSHGMKQRLAIAQALLGRPELLVLDEPTDGLDPEQIRAMRELLARLGAEGHTVLVSSHLLAEVEQTCTHIAVVQGGRLMASGSIGELVGAGRTVVVETDDRDRARAVLGRHLGADSIGPSGTGLAVTLGEHDPADLVTWLVADGLRVRALTPRGKLEDAFLSLTGRPAPGFPPDVPGERT